MMMSGKAVLRRALLGILARAAACIPLSFALLAAGTPPSEPSPTLPHGVATLGTVHHRAVLVAGDGSLPVFDDAVQGFARRLVAGGSVAPGDIQRLSATPAIVTRNGARSASLDHVLDAVAAMRPGPGQGCLVFATSHGVPYRGLYLSVHDEVLSPANLDRALARGCGNAPTVVVISACFSGSFARPPMARANRVLLTAARADRASFGCGAGRRYTVYDHCLLDALDAGGTWQGAYGRIRACVSREETRGGFTPSEPQAWFGSAAADMPLPPRAVAVPP